jgi:hypothetical protein
VKLSLHECPQKKTSESDESFGLLIVLWNLQPIILYVCYQKHKAKSPTFWMWTYNYFLLIQFLFCKYDNSNILQGLQMRVAISCYMLVDFQLCFYSNVIFSNMGSRSSVRPNHPPLALSANFSFLIQMMFQLYITQWHNNILLDNC